MMFSGIKIVTILIIVLMSVATTEEACLNTLSLFELDGKWLLCHELKKKDHILQICTRKSYRVLCCWTCNKVCRDITAPITFEKRRFKCPDLKKDSALKRIFCGLVKTRLMCCKSCVENV